MSSTNDTVGPSLGSGVGRLAGCLWLVLGGFGFLFVAGAAGVGIDATFVLVPLVVLPFGLSLLVFGVGDRAWAQLISAATGLGYAALGVWNYLRAEEFEQANPGSVEISGGEASMTFVLLTLAISLWSFGAFGVIRRRNRHES